MQINSISVLGVASSVWTNATRNLTNPSGVFSDASRTLTADPATDAGAATLVWGHSSRNLTNPSGVFSDTSRSLTNAGAWSLISVSNGSLATSSALDLRAPSGMCQHINIGYTQQGADFGALIQSSDGTHFYTIVSIPLSSQGGIGDLVGNNTVGGRIINNSATTAGNYNYGGYRITV